LALETNPGSEISSGDRRMAFGAIASGVVSIIKAVLQLLLLPVMARLLGPSEFGLYALAFPTISLVTLLADGGLGSSLVREQESSTLVWSSAFWALQIMGVTLAIASSGFGVFLGYAAQQPRLPGLIALLSLSLVFLTLSVVPSARLTRRKNIGVGAFTDLVSTLIGAAVAVVLAFYGAGAWSLAVQYVTTYAVRALIMNLAVLQLPGTQFSLTALRPHLVSGGILIASRMSEYAGRAAENFMVDRIFGTAFLGSFTFANQVSKFATDSAANMSWGALYVQALTEDKSRIIVLHRQLCRLLGVAIFPATFIGAAAAPELVSLLLGPKWVDLTFLLRVFLPLYALSAICAQTSPILLAYGRFDLQFWVTLALTLARLLAVGLGFWIGLAGAVYGIAAVTLIYCAAMLIMPADVTGCRPLPVLLALVRPAICSGIAAAAYLFFISTMPVSLVFTLACLLAALLVYGLCMILLDRKALIEDWVSARRIIAPRKA
jgi:O-antigen/teichoic acid export membrane protein